MNNVNDLITILSEKRDFAYACGWIGEMIRELPNDRDLKLTKKQIAALEAIVSRNIDWAKE